MLPFQGANGGGINYPMRCIGLKSIWLSAKRLYRHCKFGLLPERQIYFSPMATPWGEFSPIAKRSGALGIKLNGIKKLCCPFRAQMVGGIYYPMRCIGH
ncbi:MAG: hypothetical protein LBN95_12870 [Prevotellaceae bacterium]|nr:hypothetical protein [Prevotellaceae bacterium]